MFRISVLMLVSVGLLAGCDARPLNELTYAEQQEMLKTLTAVCAESGVSEESPQYETCMQAEINAENAKRKRQTEGMQNMATGISEASDSYSEAYQNNRTVTCTTPPSVGWGSTTTTCY